MNIKYDILEFIPNTGTIVVKWYSDEVPYGLVYNVDLPIIDDSYPELHELDNIIKQFQPTGQLERIAALRNAQVPEYLEKLIYNPFEKVNT
jgi:hypothetical protein